MIVKASQRANAQQLAVHLLNAHDNETVQVAHIRGAIAHDLQGALKEWQALSRATKCQKYLYSLSINPDPTQKALSRRQYNDYIARVEKKLGLSGQPRAIVFHTKNGRAHCHVVWSRIIPDQLKAIQISHDRKTLQSLTRRFAKDHGLTLPENNRKSEPPTSKNPRDNVKLSEKQQQERTGIAKEQRLHDLTKIWRDNDTGSSLVKAFAKAGYHLARGASVPYAIVDPYGEIHSLARQIEGVRTKDLRTRLKDFPPETLPDARTVREDIQSRLQKQITTNFNHSAQNAWTDLQNAHDQRRAAFHKKLAILKENHKAERHTLFATQKETLQTMRETRRVPTGIMALWSFLPGIKTFIASRHKRQDMICLKAFKEERHALIGRQRSEFNDLKRQTKAIARVENREWRSLKTQLRRDFLQTHIPENPQKIPAKESLAAAFTQKPGKKPRLRDAFRHAALPAITAKANKNGPTSEL